jgi:hypothetical protein
MLQQSKSRTNKTSVKTKTSAAHSAKPSAKTVSPRQQLQQTTSLVITSQQRQQMICEAAYFMAKNRGFMGGNPMDDWLAAEAEIDKQLSQT